MRVVLSRKGFDSASGKYPNVILPDHRLISFPIPDSYNTGIKYEDLMIDDHTSYKDFMIELGMKDVFNEYVHLDPDIFKQVKKRHKDWKAMFGQSGSAQSHLCNQNVTKDDLFLFFGWFRKVEKKDGKYQYIKGTDKHLIFGYLQIGDIINIDPKTIYPEYLMHHPHFSRHITHGKNNCAYVARERLSFSKNHLGYGVFNDHDSLTLSSGHANKSIWKLPKYFHPSFNTTMSFHTNEKLWSLDDHNTYLKSVGRGQEFVLSGNDKIENWAKHLIINQCGGINE